MPTVADPVAGRWYHDRASDERFHVVNLDSNAGRVEIQHFDGRMESVLLDEWYDSPFEPSEPPQDFTGGMEPLERDDVEFSNMSAEPPEQPGTSDAYREENLERADVVRRDRNRRDH